MLELRCWLGAELGTEAIIANSELVRTCTLQTWLLGEISIWQLLSTITISNESVAALSRLWQFYKSGGCFTSASKDCTRYPGRENWGSETQCPTSPMAM